MSARNLEKRLTVIVPDDGTDLDDFGPIVAAGLTAAHKHLPCRFFYDARGSELFEEICELPEYYLTRTESRILADSADEITARFPDPITLVELGSGSSTKTRIVIEAFLRRHGGLRYVPVDISRTMLEESSLSLIESYQGLSIIAIAAEYKEGLRELGSQSRGAKLILWLGSTLGNLSREEAPAFLKGVCATMEARDRLLIGIDLRKDRRVLEAAYNDERGVTAEFNRNVLARINSELGGRFDLSTFRHEAPYNEELGRIEMYLASTCAQRVPIEGLGLDIELAAGERIHTENSYKYSHGEIEELGRLSGLALEHQWFDDERRFSLNLFAPV